MATEASLQILDLESKSIVVEWRVDLKKQVSEIVDPGEHCTASNNKYLKMYTRSIEDPAGFRSDIAYEFYWKEKWLPQVYYENLDIQKGSIQFKWFKGGVRNICYHCLDRNFDSGNGDNIALNWEGNELGFDGSLTYSQTLERVCQASVLKVNIHCDGCKQKVKKILQKIEGHQKCGNMFGWKQRYQVALGIAEAVEHLHSGVAETIIHIDVKSSNILLFRDFDPKLSDFGLAMLASGGSSRDIDSTGLMGTLGSEMENCCCCVERGTERFGMMGLMRCGSFGSKRVSFSAIDSMNIDCYDSTPTKKLCIKNHDPIFTYDQEKSPLESLPQDILC